MIEAIKTRSTRMGEGYGRARVHHIAGHHDHRVAIDLGDGPCEMTAAQARKLAGLLLEAADAEPVAD
jgi:hypothetical protein